MGIHPTTICRAPLAASHWASSQPLTSPNRKHFQNETNNNINQARLDDDFYDFSNLHKKACKKRVRLGPWCFHSESPSRRIGQGRQVGVDLRPQPPRGGADGADGADVYHQSSFCLELFSPCFFFWLCRQTSLIFIPNLNFKDFSRIKTLVAMPNFKPQNHIKSTSDVRVSYKISNFSNWS